MYRYTVKCTFTVPDNALVERWLDWLRTRHLDDVMAGGAVGAEIVRMTDELPSYEIRYRFPDGQSFADYIRNHAPALRQEGLELFPLDLGLKYERSDGEVIHEHEQSTP